MAIDPGMKASAGGQQRCGARRGGQRFLGRLDLAFLVEVRRHQPLVLVEGVAGSIENNAAIEDA